MAIFKTASGDEVEFKYDFLHVTPPQRPLEIFRDDENDLTTDGWVKAKS